MIYVFANFVETNDILYIRNMSETQFVIINKLKIK